MSDPAPTAAPTGGSGTSGSGPSTASNGSVVGPAGKTSTPRVRRGRKIRQSQVADVVVLAAEGRPASKIARLTAIHYDAVKATLARPEVQLDIAKRREFIRAASLTRLSELTPPAWEMAKECIENRDTRGFDATTRGLAAMEKIGVSASGEAQRVEHSGSVHVDTKPAAEELRVLIGIITGRQP